MCKEMKLSYLILEHTDEENLKATAQASEDPWTACGMWLEAQQRWLEAGQIQASMRSRA